MGHARDRKLLRVIWVCTCATTRAVERSDRTLSADTDKRKYSPGGPDADPSNDVAVFMELCAAVQYYRQRPQKEGFKRLQWTMN